ncbi:carboxypeptidase-like regulatory domain-containing protein [Coraliomargarita parva]|uniref:carboxypeptidase-like regulatory domain-containing protein n=1 Tax=Coraliomargarita parva TaxID=3014050 RepID=UPI0022B3DD5D|nr:carboxypeptidase-like regulatory domain-containing protein [Coraliomargarita parva]
MNLSLLCEKLAAGHFETARRIGLQLLAEDTEPKDEVLLILHDALVNLADFKGARELLENHSEALAKRQFESSLRLAQDLRTLASENHYRLSEEAGQGYSWDEYIAKYRKLSAEALIEARKLAQTPDQEEQVDHAHAEQGRGPYDNPKPLEVPEFPPNPGSSLSGTIQWPDGSPVAGATVTLGLKVEVEVPDPDTFTSSAMDFAPRIGPMRKMTARTDAKGHFSIQDVPVGVHDFLAVTMDPLQHALPTRFLTRGIQIEQAGHTELGTLTIEKWTSAPAKAIESPHPNQFEANGTQWIKCAEWTLENPFYYDFPTQLLTLPMDSTSGSLRVRIESEEDHPFQINARNEVCLLTGLPRNQQRVIAVYQSESRDYTPTDPATSIQIETDSDGILQIDTGCASFRMPGPEAAIGTAPLLAVKGVDALWRGEGRFQLPEGVQISEQSSCIVETGPILVTVAHDYRLSDDSQLSLSFTALAGQALLLAEERTTAADAAFEFSLREFSGGRSYLHWCVENGSRHWTQIEAKDSTLAQLQESIAWWIPPNGFACAMTPEGLEKKDYIGVFSRLRGQWDDKLFESYSKGPLDRDGTRNRELEWPYPEMVGSTVSMISAHSSADADAYFRFPFFEGTRHWGLLVSSFDQNDGHDKALGRIQHAYSSPRLQELKDWHFDEPDQVERPHLITERKDLIHLRKKAQSGPFSGLWQKIQSEEKTPGPRDGVVFAIDADPMLAWKKRIQLTEEVNIRSKMTLLGRDWGDMYSPVGGRSITTAVEEYDCLAPSGVFTKKEERRIRAHFILMAHMFMEPDFMNWKYGGRNANFEADRVDIVGAIGLVFLGHPDAEKFTQHVIERNQSALLAYCTPGSGRWYENPACYYLHASRCRINLIFHLAHKGLIDINEIPRLKDFLRWGIHLLTPPHPVDYQVMHAGDAESYAAADKVRKVPPVGDHAGIGRWLSEHYAFISKLYETSDPEFAEELKQAYFAANADGQRLLGQGSWENNGPETGPHSEFTSANFGNLPLFFCNFEADDLPSTLTVKPTGRRLEGFGAVFRNQVNQSDESYLLTYQGPGGYRYQRSQGSFIYFAKGIPLVFDGGEAGETWRHNTLSFHDVHMPLSSGHVERHFDAEGIQFCQGVHPVILKPGDPVFLNDDCRHTLVEECYRRFEIEQPAVSRCFTWIDDDYLIIHDDLQHAQTVKSHWHIQVAGEAPQAMENNGFRFPGRFGLDLQVILPDQTFIAQKSEKIPVSYYSGTPDEWFAMQHLQLSGSNQTSYLAALKPLEAGATSDFKCESLKQGEQIIGSHITEAANEDFLWFQRDGLTWNNDQLSFAGSFGAYLQRPDTTRWVLLAAGSLTTDELKLESDGPSVVLNLKDGQLSIHAEGQGSIRIQSCDVSQPTEINVDGSIHESIDPSAVLTT